MRTLLVFVLVLIVAAGGAVGFAYSGLLDVSSTASEPRLFRWLLQTARENSVQRRAADIAVPDLSSKTQVAGGASAFGEMCAGCHGAPERDPMIGAKDMNPAPPNLAETVAERTPAELFWVIKHGIRMTGMPAWGPTHSDAQLWELVAFLEQLPALSADDFRELLARSGGDGHGHDHGGGHGDDHGDVQADAQGPQAHDEPHEHGSADSHAH